MDISAKYKRIRTWEAILAEISCADSTRLTLQHEIRQYAQRLNAIWSDPALMTEDALSALQSAEASIESQMEDIRVRLSSHIPTAKSGHI